MRFLNSTMINRSLIAFNAGPSAIGMPVNTNETCEVVTVKGKGGEPVRMNKSDYDAAIAGDPKAFTLHTKESKTHTADGIAKDHETGTAGQSPQLNDAEKAMREKIAAMNVGVVQEGVKFFVVDQEADGSLRSRLNCNDKGKPLAPAKWEYPEIDPKGYDTNQDAWQMAHWLKGLITEPTIPVSAPTPAADDE